MAYVIFVSVTLVSHINVPDLKIPKGHLYIKMNREKNSLGLFDKQNINNAWTKLFIQVSRSDDLAETITVLRR